MAETTKRNDPLTLLGEVDALAARMSRFVFLLGSCVVLYRLVHASEVQDEKIILLFAWPALLVTGALAMLQLVGSVIHFIDISMPPFGRHILIRCLSLLLALIIGTGMAFWGLMILSLEITGVGSELLRRP